MKTTAKQNAMNNTMALWSELYYHRLDGKPYQCSTIFQGMKTTAKQNAMNNIMALWSELYFHRLDGKPYQSSCFMLVLHSLFGDLSCRGV
jgi:hypothetical protein